MPYKYKYTQTWFLNSELRQRILKFMDVTKKHTILEIGCFEGLSSVFFADNLLEHPESTLTCVDPFMIIPNNDHSQFLQANEEMNFDYNISHCKHTNKITVIKKISDDFFSNNTDQFSFIYIDGCHEPEYIMRDMENGFKILAVGGIMWMDDYLGGRDGKIKETMDSFLKKYKGQYIIIHNKYQLGISKLKKKKNQYKQNK